MSLPYTLLLVATLEEERGEKRKKREEEREGKREKEREERMNRRKRKDKNISEFLNFYNLTPFSPKCSLTTPDSLEQVSFLLRMLSFFTNITTYSTLPLSFI